MHLQFKSKGLKTKRAYDRLPARVQRQAQLRDSEAETELSYSAFYSIQASSRLDGARPHGEDRLVYSVHHSNVTLTYKRPPGHTRIMFNGASGCPSAQS